MSHYKPYSAYKDSEVEWLGKVPEHWAVSPLKYVVTFRSGGTPSKDKLEFWDGDIPWASAKDLKKEQLDDTQDHLTELAVTSGAASLVPAGSVLVVVRGMILARIFPVAEARVPMAINQDLKALYASSKLDGRFLAHLLRGLTGESLSRLEEAGHGTKALRMEAWTSMQLTVPPSEEQCVILSHLDRETARIDALIEKKTRFIELLREKTLSLVGKAFECEESRWIRLQHVCDVVSRSIGREEEKSYVRLGLYNRGRGIFKKEETDAEDMGDSEFFWIEPGDLILSGQFAWEGAVALAGIEHEACVVSHRYPVIRGRAGEVLTEYLFAFFLSHYGDFLLNDCSRGSAGRNRPLNIVSLLKWKIPVPPMELQEKVASLVRYRRELLQKVETSVNLLKERRSALITSAVTGQIDLREAV